VKSIPGSKEIMLWNCEGEGRSGTWSMGPVERLKTKCSASSMSRMRGRPRVFSSPERTAEADLRLTTQLYRKIRTITRSVAHACRRNSSGRSAEHVSSARGTQSLLYQGSTRRQTRSDGAWSGDASGRHDWDVEWNGLRMASKDLWRKRLVEGETMRAPYC